MEDTTWEQRLQALTHLLTSPTTTPPLYSQFFISTQIPCYLKWDYPPILCTKDTKTFPSLLLRWGFSLFLKRASRLGCPETSWRSKCPYQQPPPLILAKGLEEAQWGDEQRREYVRKRLRRKKLVSNVNPFIPILVPNLLLFSLMLWNPFPDLDSWAMSCGIVARMCKPSFANFGINFEFVIILTFGTWITIVSPIPFHSLWPAYVSYKLECPGKWKDKKLWHPSIPSTKRWWRSIKCEQEILRPLNCTHKSQTNWTIMKAQRGYNVFFSYIAWS